MLISIAFLNSNCSDCSKEAIIKDQFNNDLYSQIMPYTGTEKFTFLKNNTDTVIIQYLRKEVSYNEITKEGSDPACAQRYKLRSEKVIFQPDKGNFSFFVGYFLTEGFEDKYVFGISSNSDFGPYGISSNFIQMPFNTAHQSFANVRYFGNAKLDSIYFNPENTLGSSFKFIRIKYGTDVYEILP